MVLGEAVAGVLLTAAAGPGWHIAACRLGIDGHSPTGPAPDGSVIATVIRSALADAGLHAADIGLLKPHAGGLDATAAAEAHALTAVFGSTQPRQLDFKAALGHTLGASGLAELGLLLATLDHPPSTARHALFNLIGFGGSIAALVLSRDRSHPTTAPGDEGTATETARITLELDSAELTHRARTALGAPVRRAGTLAELCLAGVDACLDATATEQGLARSTAVLFASRSGPRAAFHRVLEDLCLRNEDPMPFDFLATQAMLAALPLKHCLPELEAACYLPLTGDTELQWLRMTTLARAWLASGRHDRVLLGMVEPGQDKHHCEWRSLSAAAPSERPPSESRSQPRPWRR
ncbi:MAG: hypothetical protein CVU25_07600 [Betaproteobacteria bacterium HGW-Betaproteobacteria-19]|nr:MAG: hypothetical protein CVU25_07600 [Betaproteobacteria bacterium HGW-Betaproteobacteria-19]